jgi:hypothetical protein
VGGHNRRQDCRLWAQQRRPRPATLMNPALWQAGAGTGVVPAPAVKASGCGRCAQTRRALLLANRYVATVQPP